MRLRTRLLLFFKGFQIWLQRQGRRETIMTGMHVNLIKKLVQSGDILLSYESGRWTSFFIRGNYDHAAILSNRLDVIEAVGDKFVNGVNIGGVRKVDLTEWLYKKDHVAVIRPQLRDPLTNFFAADEAFNYIGKGYDYGFERGGNTVYCSELEYLCYSKFDKTFLDHIPEDKEILPINYLEMCKIQPDRFKVIYNTRG